MTWFKVDDSFYDHPKVFDAPDCAVALWARAGCWAARNLTDGFVPAGMPARLCDDPDTAVKELVDRGLWRRAKGGFQFRDWTDYQPSAERVKATRAVRAEAGSRGGKAKAAKQKASNLLDGSQDFAKQNPAPTRPDPTRDEEEADASSSGTAAPRSKKGTKRGTRIPEPFPVDADMVEWAHSECPLVDGKYETAQFCDYWAAKTGTNAVKLDWSRTWKTWMRKAQRDAGERRPSNVVAIRPKQAAKEDLFAEAFARAAAQEVGQS